MSIALTPTANPLTGLSANRSASSALPSRERAGLWLPLAVWVFIITTLASFRVRQSEELWVQGGFDWQVKYQAASWVALGLLAAGLVLAGHADLGLLRQGPLFWYCGFILIAILSAAFAPSPVLTAFRSVQLAVAVVLVVALRRRLDYLYFFLCVFLALNWALLLVGALGIGTQLEWIRPPHELFVFHAGSRDDAWRFGTALGHPSQISAVAAVVAVGLAARARGRQWVMLGPVIAWCVVTNLMTVSRTGIAGMLAGFLFVAWSRRKLLPLTVLAGIALPLVLWPDSVQEAIVRFVARGQNSKEFSTLTGRDTVFAEGWNRVVDSAFIGEGFAAGRTHLLAKSWGASHAHNLFLQAATTLGLPGLVLVTLVVATYLRDVWSLLRRRPDDDTGPAVEFAAIAVPLLACCLLDSGFAATLDPFVLMFLGVAARLGQVVSLHVDESLRDSHWRLGETRPRDATDRRAPTSPLFSPSPVP